MREKIAFKSSMVGIISQITIMMLAVISTRVFMQNLGAEIKGLNGVLASCLGMLQLAEMGIGSAIIYALYQPIVDGNIKEIQILMKFYKNAYRVIGTVIFILGIGMSFFLDFFVTDSTCSESYILVVFYIQLVTAVSSYFLSYKRNLLYADQKQYVTTIVDTIFKIIISVAKIAVILLWESYIAYLLLDIVQTVGSNMFISIWCNRQYPYLKEKVSGKYDKMNQLVHNVKDLIIGKLGGYVYTATDQLVVSKIVGIAAVGYMSSYYQVSNIFKNLSSSITGPIQPMIGNYIRQEKDKNRVYDLFLSYTFIRYCIANVIVVGMITMIDPLIELWLGEQFKMPMIVPVLLAIDIFISIVHGPTGEFVIVLGLFRNDRNMSLIGAALNLITSIYFSMKFGAYGVIIGTVITQIYYWAARAHIAFDSYFQRGRIRYVIKIASYISVTVAETMVMYWLRLQVLRETTVLGFIVMSIVCAVTSLFAIFVCFYRTEELKFMMRFLKKNLLKKG